MSGGSTNEARERLLWAVAIVTLLAGAALVVVGISNLNDASRLRSDARTLSRQKARVVAERHVIAQHMSGLSTAASAIQKTEQMHALDEEAVLTAANSVVSAGNTAVNLADSGDVAGAEHAFSYQVTSALDGASQVLTTAQGTLTQLRSEIDQLSKLVASK
jgi:glycerol dehydrogenase-like iron-containing ADH family enzyme